MENSEIALQERLHFKSTSVASRGILSGLGTFIVIIFFTLIILVIGFYDVWVGFEGEKSEWNEDVLMKEYDGLAVYYPSSYKPNEVNGSIEGKFVGGESINLLEYEVDSPVRFYSDILIDDKYCNGYFLELLAKKNKKFKEDGVLHRWKLNGVFTNTGDDCIGSIRVFDLSGKNLKYLIERRVIFDYSKTVHLQISYGISTDSFEVSVLRRGMMETEIII